MSPATSSPVIEQRGQCEVGGVVGRAWGEGKGEAMMPMGWWTIGRGGVKVERQ